MSEARQTTADPTNIGAAESDLSLRRKLLSPRTGLSFVVLAAIMLLLVTRFDIAWSETWEAVRTINLGWYAAAVAVHYLTFVFRGARWRLLLANAARGDEAPPPLPSVLHAGRIILMSWFVNSIAWFRAGDAYRAYVYSNESGASFARSAGTVLADRLIDLTVVVTLMSTGIAVLLIGGQVRPPLLLVLAAGALLGAVAAALLVMRLTHRWVAPKLPSRIGRAYRRFHEGTMGSFNRLPLVFGLGVLGWMCEVGRLFLVVKALGLSVALGLVLFVPMANGLLSAIPLTPGGLGIVETGVSGLLQLELVVEAALAVALVDRTISYLSIILTGGAAFAARQLRSTSRVTAASPSRATAASQDEA